MPIRVVASSPVEMCGAIMEPAREQGLSTYDAAYLHLAMRSGLPMVTLDEALRQSARRCGWRLDAGRAVLEQTLSS